MSDVDDFWQKYKSLMHKVDPERIPEVKIVGARIVTSAIAGAVEPIATSAITSSSIANWSDAGAQYALESGKTEEANGLTALKEQGIQKSEPEDIHAEIAAFYAAAYDLKNAEINLEAMASISEKKIDKNTESILTSYIDRFGSLVENAVTRIHGFFTDAFKGLKEKLGEFKNLITGFSLKVKQKLLDAFNAVLNFFFRVVAEFVSRMFSFVAMISKMAEPKGYILKTLNISFDPPGFGKVTVLGIPIPFPKFSLPKVEVGFEAKP